MMMIRCLLLILYASKFAMAASITKQDIDENIASTAPATSSKDVAANIILKELLTRVESEKKTLLFSDDDKVWVLEKLSDYLFGNDQSEIVNKVVSTKNKVNRKRHHRKPKSNIRVQRDAEGDQPMDRISFAQEYRLLYQISRLLRSEPASSEDPQQFIDAMEMAG